MRCVREITGIWRAAAILIAAAFAMAWCLAFPFAPAYADEGGVGASADDDTIVVSVPTTVPCALLSDGTVVAPTSWKVENSGSTPARLAMATATTAYDGISVSAKANGSTLLDYSAGFASYDPTLIVPAQGSLDVSWSVSPIDPTVHADLFKQAAQHPVTLLSVSFLFCAQSTEPDASDSVPFAVYSKDDASLTFYKRRALPVEGSVFEGKTATAVYANIQDTKSTPPWKGIASKIKRVAVVDDGIAPQTMYAWFFECNNLLSVNLSRLDTSETTSLGYAFSRCKSLTEIDLSKLDTSSVRSFADVFQDCSSLRSVNLAGWDTSSGKDFRQMFYRCASLEEIDISSFKTSASTSFEQMFYGCSSLRSLDLSHFDTGSATTFASMFYNCASLATLDVSMFDTASATDLSQAFYGCKSLTELDLSRASTAKVQTFHGMFSGCSGLKRIDLSLLDTSSAVNLSYLFADCSKLEAVDFAGINMSSVTDFNYMFSECSSLASLDLSSFDTAAAKNLSYLFYNCASFASLDLSSFDTSNVETMENLFSGCSKLAEVALGESFAWVGSKCFLPQPSAGDIPGADGLWHAASDGVSYRPSAVPGNKADTYRAVAPGGEGNAVEGDAGGADVVNGANPAGAVESANGAGAAEDAGNAGCAGSENAAGGAGAPDSENHAIAAESMMALGREDYMIALAMANPSAAAPSVVA
ncbi:BspA family leucine-rich repeat surface protein [Ellagibacter isourolithinifaciens]|uniref:BspA family leucine-rich repeat surface protein n=1 Tax=Ellagibacter isourolithinifaciens TaxID=2137581 RepID=UPI002E75DB5C|nr:BspA family leucine-rich repeat surface protein [Ellagibacter isourolithinifaciens]MEE0246235.1 BspA family leucine-rich repeat surface protein [Ellagibacter isourolithinifaciens]